MNAPTAGKSGVFALEELESLNMEIAALVRAGVPLDQGLALVGKETPGRLGALMRRLAERVERGEGLDTAIAAEDAALPEAYRTMVSAGLRSGRLAAVLESSAESARRLAELRRVTGMAVLYPTIVVVIAIVLFAFYVIYLTPEIARFELPDQYVLEWILSLRGSAPYWGTLGPLLVVLAVVVWWIQSRRATTIDGQRRWFAWAPSFRKIRFFGHAATFAEVLRVLVEHDVPLGEALRLAGSACRDQQMKQGSEMVATAVERGEPLQTTLPGLSALPPLVQPALGAPGSTDRLVRTLQFASESYREQAVFQMETTRLYLPALLTVVIGASVTFLYLLTLFVPYVQILNAVAR